MEMLSARAVEKTGSWRSDLKVSDVMSSNPVTVQKGDLATRVRFLFRRSRFRSLPVIDNGDRVIGIITRKDILCVTSTRSNILVEGLMSHPLLLLTPHEDLPSAIRKMVEASVSTAIVVEGETLPKLVGVLSVSDLFHVLLQQDLPSLNVPLEEIMTREVATCDVKDAITKVWTLMEETGYSGIPVLKNGRLIGMITRMDILDAGCARIQREDEKGKGKYQTRVEKVMRTPVITLGPREKVREAMRVMLGRGIGRIPVAEGAHILGIVDREDLLRRCLS
jgi:CBS domain-containing protein